MLCCLMATFRIESTGKGFAFDEAALHQPGVPEYHRRIGGIIAGLCVGQSRL